MTGPIRRAGECRLIDGSTVTWTVAEGTKGRRWREVVVRDGAIVHSLLLETFPDGRFAHIELAAPTGLLTLHPEGDGTLHGNTVTARGVGHIRGLPWSDATIVLVTGSVVAAVAARHRLQDGDGTARLDAIEIRSDLTLRRTRPVAADLSVPIGDDGVPAPGDGRSWPLEEEGSGTPSAV
ncbi:MAG TPA: hypothetical protein VGK63_06880 [Candidatus Limnocylindrales bacterium]